MLKMGVVPAGMVLTMKEGPRNITGLEDLGVRYPSSVRLFVYLSTGVWSLCRLLSGHVVLVVVRV